MTPTAIDTGCTAKPVITAKPKTVSVNGVVVSRSAIARETQNHPAAKPIEAWQSAARALVIRELLLQEAQRLNLAPVPLSDGEGRRETDEEALIRQVLEQEVSTPDADDETCLRYYRHNASRFRTPELFEVSHILVPDGADAERIASELLAALRDDPGTFGALAAAHSVCPSRAVGGSLGQIGPGQTVPEFEAALPTLPVGLVAPEPVRSRYGQHIVRVERHLLGCVLPFDLVRERIAAFLTDRVRHVAERQYLTILSGRARIEGITFEAAASPLVQ